jgi:hypothetical protein
MQYGLQGDQAVLQRPDLIFADSCPNPINPIAKSFMERIC